MQLPALSKLLSAKIVPECREPHPERYWPAGQLGQSAHCVASFVEREVGLYLPTWHWLHVQLSLEGEYEPAR